MLYLEETEVDEIADEGKDLNFLHSSALVPYTKPWIKHTLDPLLTCCTPPFNPFIFINKNRPLISLIVPTNLNHDKFAAGIRALGKGGNGPLYSTAVARDLGKKAGMAHFILQQL